MKWSNLLLFLCLLFTETFSGQTDSILVPGDLALNDAVYITYNDFRYNNGILKEQIISSANNGQLDFVGKSLEKENFTYKADQKTNTVPCKTIWGFIQNKTLYINFKGSFYRVPVFGSICYLVATVEVAGVGFYDPMFGPGMGTTGRRQEVREFLINFYDGNVTEFKMDEAELLISRDKVLFEEFKKLNRRKQKDQIFRYIRKYNEAHPVYFLK